MNSIKLTVNGKEITTKPGKTILEVVREHNIDNIPTLCHDPRIEPYGSCFLCVVEVEGMNRLVPSCCTPVGEGMKIQTDNPRIRDSRKTALELLLSNHYADCIGPCINNCPAHVDAQGYIALISAGKFTEALQLIKQQNPLPLSIGRVCVRDCEVACRRQIIDESVGINHLKRYVADMDIPHKWVPDVQPHNGRKVAVVGAGPSGMSCAYYLTLEGFKVTVFEKLERPGGMLMYGIPQYRLPKEILEDEIKWMLDLGIELKTGCEMGKDFTIKSLLNDGFDSVFAAVGAHKASTMRLDHENDTEGVMWGIDFLRQLPAKPPRLEGNVIVVGGGNTAIDAARTALRCGAETVKIVYRRSIKEMPAHDEEIHAAQEEGVEILFLNNPKSILRDDKGKLKGITCIKMRLEDAQPGQRPRPVPIDDSDFDIACDYLIGAIGQQVDTRFAGGDDNLELEAWGTIKINPDTMETSIKGVFAGGDAVTGPDTAINAIAQGKRAANAIMQYMETGNVEKSLDRFYSFKHTISEVSENELQDFEKIPRNRMPELPLQERLDSFCEVELGYTPEQAEEEPKRCLECGCSEYDDCELRRQADQFGVDIQPFIGETRKFMVDRRHPLIVMDPNKCINCGRCVRTCAEILKVSALGFVNRGFRAVVKPAMEKPLLETNCVACGNCIDTCPTGALTEKFPFKVMGTLEKKNYETICNFCSLGCRINVKVMDNGMYYVANSTDSIRQDINEGYLCVRGRFGHRYLNGDKRLSSPLVIDNDGVYRDADWNQAINHAVDRVKDIIDRYGIDAVAVTVSPNLSNEELYLLQKFTRAGLKNNNIGSFSHFGANPGDWDGLDRSMGITASNVSLDNIREADVVVVLNGNLSEENLIMELKIKKAQKQHGTKLILLNSSEIKLAKFSDLWIDSRRGTNTVIMNGLIREFLLKQDDTDSFQDIEGFLTMKEMVESYTPEKVTEISGITMEKYLRMVDWLTKPGQRVVFVYNTDSHLEKSRNDLQAVGNYLLLNRYSETGSGIIMLRDYVNSTGLLEMGAVPQFMPGLVKPGETGAVLNIQKHWGSPLQGLFQPIRLEEKLLNGDIKALLIFGEDPLSVADNHRYFKNIQFLLVHDLFKTSTAEAADIILPAASFLEQEGTYTACDRRVQAAPRILASPSGKENWQVISSLANAFNLSFQYKNASKISSEIHEVNRLYSSANPGEYVLPFKSKPAFTVYDTDTTPFNPNPSSLLAHENHYRRHIRARLSF